MRDERGLAVMLFCEEHFAEATVLMRGKEQGSEGVTRSAMVYRFVSI